MRLKSVIFWVFIFISRIPGGSSANPAPDKREYNTWWFHHVITRRIFLLREKNPQAEMSSIYPGAELKTSDPYFLSRYTKVVCLPSQDYWSSSRPQHQESGLLAWHGVRWRKVGSIFISSCKSCQRFQKSLSRSGEWSPPRDEDPRVPYRVLKAQTSTYINTGENQLSL